MDLKNLAILVGVIAVILLAIGVAGASGPEPSDLELTKVDSADPVAPGANVTYAITVRNNGVRDASGVVVTDRLPAEVDYASASNPLGGCDLSDRTVTCALGEVDTGASATTTITVKAKKEGTPSTTAMVASAGDSNRANDADTETTVISRDAEAVSP